MAEKMAVMGLLHKRSRLAGDIARLVTLNRRAAEKIEALQSKIAENLTKISSCHTQIESLGFAAVLGFDRTLPPPSPRRTYAKQHFTAWGEVTRSTLRSLKNAHGIPLTPTEIADAIEIEQNLNLSDEDSVKLRASVRSTLKRLGAKG
jgi:hypothetical protein